MAIIIGGMSLYYKEYYIAIISLLIILTGSKLWQPCPFFTNDEKVNIMNAIGLYLKSQGRKRKDITEFDIRYIGSLYEKTKIEIVNFIDYCCEIYEQK